MITGLNQLFVCTHFVYLIAIISLSTAAECKDDTLQPKCCSGHRKINETCEECIGFYGEDCGIPCPTGSYGPGCISKCNCSVHETCNQFVGCRLLSTFESKYRKSVHNETCSSLFISVIALTASQTVTLICCLKTLRWKDCRLSPKQTKSFTRHGTVMTLSPTSFGMSEARNEPSKHLGSSCEDEITKGIHCHTERYQDNLECPSNTYDTFETADRIKKQ